MDYLIELPECYFLGRAPYLIYLNRSFCIYSQELSESFAGEESARRGDTGEARLLAVNIEARGLGVLHDSGK
jgi:hypothetical protein